MRMAAYCRVSTDREEQLSSLENQRLFFSEYAEKNGDTLVEIYADEGISGKSMKKREAFTKLLRDGGQGLFDYVAVKDISRFARNTSDFLYGIRTLRENGVDVRFLSGNQTVIGESEFVLTVFAALAQEESANLSKRVIFGKKQNAKKGRVPNQIYGYDKLDTYTLRINDAEAEAVRLMFRLYADGDGTRRIAARLNEMGIPTKRGAKWESRTVRRVLSNPVYSGRLVNNKTVTKDFLSGTRKNIPEEEWFVHERPELEIVSGGEFELVQKLLDKRRKQYGMPAGRYSCRHLFSNLIFCGECGGAFNARVLRGKNTRVRYRCRAHNNGGAAVCKNAVWADEAELLAEVKNYILSVLPDNIFDNITELNEEKSGKEPQLYHARKRLLDRRSRIREMYLSGLSDIEELEAEYADIDRELLKIEDTLAERGEKTAARNTDAAKPAEVISDFQFTNRDMRELVDKIIVYPEKKAEIFLQNGGL